MLSNSRGNLLFLAALIGIATHQLVFRHGEWHMHAMAILYFYTLLSSIVLGLAIMQNNYLHWLQINIILMITYTGSLLASMIIYRGFFHRLRRFPGPLCARITKFWHVFKCIQSSSQNHLVLEELRKQYGDFVRTGPSEITVFNPEVFRATDGIGSSCTKADWYDFLLPELAVNTTRDKAKHDQRRRIWDRAFTAGAMAEYQKSIADFAIHFDRAMERSARHQETIDMSSWIYWYSFDVMGHFAFARSFDMLRDEKWHYAIVLLRRAMSLLGPMSPVPWLAQIGFTLFPNTWVVKDWNTMMRWCRTRMTERISMSTQIPDVSSHLIEPSLRSDHSQEEIHWLNGDAIAIIIAGSDTVAPTLVCLLYELSKNPSKQEKLRSELRTCQVSDHKELQSLAYLNGVINETLRLHPPVPTGGYRDTPPEGITIGGTFIPGGTTIVAPRYSIGRLESCFEQAGIFIPERWCAKVEQGMVRNRQAFMPFSQGRYSCVGKRLALAEIRYIVAMLVSKYILTFAPGENGLEVETRMKDQFTAAPGKLRLQLALVKSG